MDRPHELPADGDCGTGTGLCRKQPGARTTGSTNLRRAARGLSAGFDENRTPSHEPRAGRNSVQRFPPATSGTPGSGPAAVLGGFVADLLFPLESPRRWAHGSRLARQPRVSGIGSSRRTSPSHFDLRRRSLLSWWFYLHPDIGRYLCGVSVRRDCRSQQRCQWCESKAKLITQFRPHTNAPNSSNNGTSRKWECPAGSNERWGDRSGFKRIGKSGSGFKSAENGGAKREEKRSVVHARPLRAHSGGLHFRRLSGSRVGSANVFLS